MLESIKIRLRNWLLSDVTTESKDVSPYLDCRVPGQGIQQFLVTGAQGMRLVGQPVKGSGVRLIGEGEAVNQKQFKRLRDLYVDTSELVWDDGEPYSS